MENTIIIDNQEIPFQNGQTIMDAAMKAGVYIPHLCHHPEFEPHGSCRICTVKVNGRLMSSCTTKATAGQQIENNTPELQENRRCLVQMLFVEGNHICPACEKSGNCQLQAIAYYTEMLTPRFQHFYPYRELDASHPDIIIDFNRCILCELCVRASRDVDQKHIFSISGRGINSHLIINSPTGKLGDTNLSVNDKAVQVCPVGAIMKRKSGYLDPIGERFYDRAPINEIGDITQSHAGAKHHG